jgi:hypothetical protein
MFFDDWTGLARVATVGILAYVGLILLLRVSGKRTLSKMNAFDLVWSPSPSALPWQRCSSPRASHGRGLARLRPADLPAARRHLPLGESLDRPAAGQERAYAAVPREKLPAGRRAAERVTEEVEAAVRQQGLATLDKVGVAVLETDGSVTVVPRLDLVRESALFNVATRGSDE